MGSKPRNAALSCSRKQPWAQQHSTKVTLTLMGLSSPQAHRLHKQMEMGQGPGANSQLLIHVSAGLSTGTRGETSFKGNFYSAVAGERGLFGGFAINKEQASGK